jgi:hypothetical protein
VIKTIARGLGLGLFLGLVLEVCLRVLLSDVARSLGGQQDWWWIPKATDLSPFLSFGIVFGVVVTVLSRRPRPASRRVSFGWAVLAMGARAVASGVIVAGLGELLGLLYEWRIDRSSLHSFVLTQALGTALASFFAGWVEETVERIGKNRFAVDVVAAVSCGLGSVLASTGGWAGRSYLETVWKTGSVPEAAGALASVLGDQGWYGKTPLALAVSFAVHVLARRRRLSLAQESTLVVLTSFVVLFVLVPVNVTITGTGSAPGLKVFLFLAPLTCCFATAFVPLVAIPLGGWLSDLVRARAPAIEEAATDEPERPQP